MADLIPKTTDEEIERYMEADMVRRARMPMEGNAALKFEADPITGRENAYFPLSAGGYVKIGDRAVTPVQASETDVLAAEREIQNDARGPISEVIGGADGPVMDDYLAAGFTEAEVREYQAQERARMLSQPGMQVPVQLTEEQMQFGEQVGAPMLREAPPQPGVFEGTLSEIGKGLVRGGIVEPSRFVKENFNLYDPLVFQVIDPRTGEFDPQLRIVSREEKAEIDRAIAAGEMPYAVDFEQLFERGDAAETGPGAALLGDISQFMGAYAGIGKLFRIGKGITAGMTQGAAADFFGFGGDEGRLTDLLLELGVPDNMVTDFLRTDPNDPDYVGRFKNALEGGVLGGLIEQIGPVYRMIKEGGNRTQLGQAIGNLRARSEQAFSNTISDIIGTGRAVMQGEVFQPAGTPRSLGAAAPDPETAGAITAFHGSPYDFDAFDINKLGTGEGAQVRGRGLYFAEVEDVAREYRDTLSRNMQSFDDPPRFKAFGDQEARFISPSDAQAIVNQGETAIRRRIERIERDVADLRAQSENEPEVSEIIDGMILSYDGELQELNTLLREGSDNNRPPRGRLYEVNIRANPEDFLNWDAPISQQSEKVRETLMPFVEQRIAQMGEAGSRFTPEQWMDRLRGGDVMLLDKVGDTPVSRALADAGVPGVRYFDQGSRTAGEGTRNYVVFDDQLIDIVKKYGVAGLAVGAAVQSELGGNQQIEENI